MNAGEARYPDWARKAPRLRAIALSAAGLVLLAGLIWFVNPSRVAAVLHGADLQWIALALLIIAFATLIGACNSYLITAPGPDLRFRSYFAAYWAAWALGQILPGQVGDMLGMSLYLRRRGLALPTAVGRLGVDKLISLFCTLALSVALLAIFSAPIARLASMCGGAAAIALALAFLFSRRLAGADLVQGGLRASFVNSLNAAHRVIAARPYAVLLNTLLTLLKLLIIGTCYWIIFRALHAEPGNLLEVTVTANSAGLIAYLPLSANGLGTVEAGGLYLFGLLGVTTPVVIAAYLILRVANLALAWGGTALVIMVHAWSGRTRHA